MLRALGPEELPASVAYQVPWRVDRSGEEPVHGVRLSLHGDGSVLFASNSLVAPGDHATFRASGCLTPASIVTLRWFRPDETEYLWRIAL